MSDTATGLFAGPMPSRTLKKGYGRLGTRTTVGRALASHTSLHLLYLGLYKCSYSRTTSVAIYVILNYIPRSLAMDYWNIAVRG